MQKTPPGQSDIADSFQDIGIRLGAVIRRLRREQGLTLVELAGRSRLSNPFLSQLERGLVRASMESLHRIALALGSTAPALLAAAGADASEPRVSLTRSDEGQVHRHALGVTRPLVSGTRGMYPVEFTVVSARYEEYYEHETAEMIYLISGSLEVDLETEGVHLLGTGDVLYFSGGVRHRWRAHGGHTARALVVQAGHNPHM